MGPSEERWFAWDGVVFPVPADWELAGYSYRRRAVHLILEDPVEVRLELEYLAEPDARAEKAVRKRYRTWADQFKAVASRVVPVDGVTPGWHVNQYLMKDGRSLIAALGMGRPDTELAFFRLHMPADRPGAEGLRLVRRLLAGFTWPSGEQSAWRMYDFDIRVPRHFRLRQTAFWAGRKMLRFEYRLRRLFIWHFALASRMWKEREPEDAIIEFLHKAKELPGIRVERDTAGCLIIRKKPIHLFGHYEDIGRGCFRYAWHCQIDEEGDTLALAVLHYRRASDLRWLEQVELGPGDA